MFPPLSISTSTKVFGARMGSNPKLSPPTPFVMDLILAIGKSDSFVPGRVLPKILTLYLSDTKSGLSKGAPLVNFVLRTVLSRNNPTICP